MINRRASYILVYPKTVILEAGTIPELQSKINEGENIGYQLQSIERHHTEFYQNYVGVMTRTKQKTVKLSGGKPR